MKRRSFVSLLTAALARAQNPPQALAPALPAAPVQSGFGIAGTVVNAGTNAPVGKAVVQIASAANRSQNREVVTGSDGRFSFTNLPAHKFGLTVTRQSGMPQAYLANGNFSSAIVTGPDQDTSNIVFRFHMQGTLAGTVLDESNEPVRNASIHLFSHQIDLEGIRRLVPANTGTGFTKASGQFRLPHLQPGSYLLGVSARPWFAQQNYQQRAMIQHHAGQPVEPSAVQPDPQFDVAYPFTYYPNVVDAASASSITVTEGNETAVQISLHAVPSIHVRLVGGDVKSDAGTNVQVSAVGPEGHPIPLSIAAFVQNGQGELTGLTAGRYLLGINTFRNTGARGMAFDTGEGIVASGGFGRKIVDLADGTTVDLSAASHVTVSATVKPVANDRPQNRIGLQLRDPKTGNAAFAVADKEDTIQFPVANLSPGRYEVLLSNTPAFRVLSLEAKGAKVSGGELIIGDNADVQLSVLIGRRSSVNVEGFAVRDTAPAMGAMILLLPRTSAIGSTVYRDQSDSDGSFILRGVSAGTYLALAIDDGRDLAFGEASVIKPYLTGAVTLTINESAAPPALKLPVQHRIA